jgi:hypothetical protein
MGLSYTRSDTTLEMPRHYSDWRIGLDLDNTLISYDRVFYDIAMERGFLPSDFLGTKRDIRDHVRRLPDGELEWQRLQAHVYGPAISAASATEGALDFMRLARLRGVELSIISHKTALANMGSKQLNLRDAAREWLRDSGMLGPDVVPEGNLYFEDTRAQKIARIASCGCTHFIDDLEEVFSDPTFPSDIERLLLTTTAAVPAGPYRAYASFREIAHALIAD